MHKSILKKIAKELHISVEVIQTYRIELITLHSIAKSGAVNLNILMPIYSPLFASDREVKNNEAGWTTTYRKSDKNGDRGIKLRLALLFLVPR